MRLLAGAPLAQRVAERARMASTLDEVVVATSTSAKDDILADHMRRVGFPVHRGSEDDVLGRILGASHEHLATVHVQCWGDCPFLEPGEVDRVVKALVESDCHLVGNGLGQGRELPYGLDVMALRVEALERADAATKNSPYHREHGTTYIYETPGAFKVRRLETPEDLRYPAFNVSINTEEDYAFAAAIYDALHAKDPRFGIRDVIAFVRSRPALLAHSNAQVLTAS
jgi:spore coat polysaccharide biosynthesis protein SpsF